MQCETFASKWKFTFAYLPSTLLSSHWTRRALVRQVTENPKWSVLQSLRALLPRWRNLPDMNQEFANQQLEGLLNISDLADNYRCAALWDRSHTSVFLNKTRYVQCHWLARVQHAWEFRLKAGREAAAFCPMWLLIFRKRNGQDLALTLPGGSKHKAQVSSAHNESDVHEMTDRQPDTRTHAHETGRWDWAGEEQRRS